VEGIAVRRLGGTVLDELVTSPLGSGAAMPEGGHSTSVDGAKSEGFNGNLRESEGEAQRCKLLALFLLFPVARPAIAERRRNPMHNVIRFAGLSVVLGLALVTVAPEQPRLVGLGCGPDRLTLTAVEEDEFPAPCYAVETPMALCGHDDAAACADYMGQGY
jgi:hypothetical protein